MVSGAIRQGAIVVVNGKLSCDCTSDSTQCGCITPY
jgi:hypothetical protein